MTFPVDQFTALPPVANTQANTQARLQNDRSANRDFGTDDDTPGDIESNMSVYARDNRTAENDRSDFQRHLDDDANDHSSQQSTVDNGMALASSEGEDNHGFTVSQTATTTETSKPAAQSAVTGEAAPVPSDATDDTAAIQPGKGTIVKAVAQNKPEAVNTADNTTPPQPVLLDPEVAIEPDATLAPGESNTSPVPVATEPSSSEPSGTQSAGTTEVAVTADAPAAPLSVDETLPGSSEPPFNQQAQKIEGSERPGWGAEHAPHSDRGTEARNLKSENGSANSQNSVTQDGVTVETPSGMAPATSSEDGLTATSALDSTTESDSDTDGSETIVPLPIEETPESKSSPMDPTLAAAPAQGTSEADKVDAPDVNQVAAVSAMTTPQADTNQPASNQAPSNSPTPNASPVGVARAMASGQGNMPLSAAPTPEAVEAALAGIDKRGARSAEGSRDAAPGAKSKSQSAIDLTGLKSNAGTFGQSGQNPAATASSSQANPQGAQTGQSAAPQAPPPLASFLGNADLVMPAGSSTMEVDPITGALHLTGTGSAKMSAPNLSEVTLQFSRARMIQTPAKDIAIQIARHLSNGINRFDIRITPPELGRIEIKMEIAASGKISAHLVADKPETLELLQKDRSTLEKALAEAGLDFDQSSLDFSMKEGSDKNDNDFRNLGLEIADEASDGQNTLHLEDIAELEVSAYGFDIVRMKHLDISI